MSVPPGLSELQGRLWLSIRKRERERGECDWTPAEWSQHGYGTVPAIRQALRRMELAGHVELLSGKGQSPRRRVSRLTPETERETTCYNEHATTCNTTCDKSHVGSTSVAPLSHVGSTSVAPLSHVDSRVDARAEASQSSPDSTVGDPVAPTLPQQTESNDVGTSMATPSEPEPDALPEYVNPIHGRIAKLEAARARLNAAIAAMPKPEPKPEPADPVIANPHPSWHILDRHARGEAKLPTQDQALAVLALNWRCGTRELSRAWSKILPATVKNGSARPEDWMALLPFLKRWEDPIKWPPSKQLDAIAKQIERTEIASPRVLDIDGAALETYRMLAEDQTRYPSLLALVQQHRGDIVETWRTAGLSAIGAAVDADKAELARRAKIATAAMLKRQQELGGLTVVQPEEPQQ